MWERYNRLIETVPSGIRALHVHAGPVWTIVSAEDFCGIAVTVNEQHKALPDGREFEGKDLRQLAELCKSWDFAEASIGTAALNAWTNSPDRISSCMPEKKLKDTGNTFDDYSRLVKDKKVAVIGHFVALERVLKTAAEVTVLERNPGENDLPDPACEYVLPLQDFVFITGSAFINKTLFRLLELSCNARSIIIGPSTPMSPLLFDSGADELSGLSLKSIPCEKFTETGTDTIRPSTLGKRIRMVK